MKGTKIDMEGGLLSRTEENTIQGSHSFDTTPITQT
jgi:hypothetical protein